MRSPFGVRRSNSTVVVSACGRRRADFWSLARHRGRAAPAAPTSGTEPNRVTDDQFALDEIATAHHGVGGVEHLAQPDARAPPQRGERVGEAGAGDQVVGRCTPARRARTGRAASTKNRPTPDGARDVRTRGDTSPGCRRRPRSRTPMLSRRCVHGTQATATFTLGSPRSVAASVVALGTSGAGRRSSTGTCQAPHTTTIVHDRHGPRPGSPDACGPPVAVPAGMRRGPARTAPMASATASNAAAPSPRCSMTSSHQRSGSGSPAAAARSPSGSGGGMLAEQLVVAGAVGAASVTASGRSIGLDLNVVLVRPPHRLPLGAELGERRERRAARFGDDVAEQGHRGDEIRVADPPQRRSTSAGSSTRTIAGCTASSVRTTERAEPGPW